MKAEIKKTIRLLDETLLSPLRELWLAAKTDAEKEAWRLKIDQALDMRIRLMAQRDDSSFNPQPSTFQKPEVFE